MQSQFVRALLSSLVAAMGAATAIDRSTFAQDKLFVHTFERTKLTGEYYSEGEFAQLTNSGIRSALEDAEYRGALRSP